MACDTGCCGDKDVTHCPVCGNAVPASLGVKPRKYCCARCSKAATSPRKQGASACGNCGTPISQPAGKGRKREFCKKCRKGRLRYQKDCKRCGKQFGASRPDAIFCSAGCRWPQRMFSTTGNCANCKHQFVKRTRETRYCSRACVRASPSPTRKRTVYKCLNCCKGFFRRPYRTANKYCSRECAFERKRMKSYGLRHDALSAWFHSWAEDDDRMPLDGTLSSSHKARCKRFGVPYEPIDRIAVFERHGWMCGICGRELRREYGKSNQGTGIDPASPTIDCVIPLSAGPGSPGYVYSNVQACCNACNCLKSDQHPDSFVPPYTTRLDY